VKKDSLNTWIKSGTPWIWMNAGAVSIAVVWSISGRPTLLWLITRFPVQSRA